jgi:hypothetical protein
MGIAGGRGAGAAVAVDDEAFLVGSGRVVIVTLGANIVDDEAVALAVTGIARVPDAGWKPSCRGVGVGGAAAAAVAAAPAEDLDPGGVEVPAATADTVDTAATVVATRGRVARGVPRGDGFVGDADWPRRSAGKVRDEPSGEERESACGGGDGSPNNDSAVRPGDGRPGDANGEDERLCSRERVTSGKGRTRGATAARLVRDDAPRRDE